MQTIPLTVQARTTQQSPRTLRTQGSIPGVVYGNADHALIAVEEQALKKAYVKAGESTIVELDTGKGKIPVLFHAIDFDPVTDRMTHVDFYAVDMKKEVEAEVHVRLEGESPAVKDLGAILVTALHEVTVKALPANLPHDLPVDLSKLTEMGGTLTVADIVVPEGVTILNNADEVVAIAQEPREEEVEEAPAPAEGEAAATEGATPAEGAPPVEGEAAAPTEGEKKE